MNKIQRNDPCLCGSGKKYKKCCMDKNTLAFAAPEDSDWQKLRQTEGEVIDKFLMPFVNSQFPEYVSLGWIRPSLYYTMKPLDRLQKPKKVENV